MVGLFCGNESLFAVVFDIFLHYTWIAEQYVENNFSCFCNIVAVCYAYGPVYTPVIFLGIVVYRASRQSAVRYEYLFVVGGCEYGAEYLYFLDRKSVV